MVRPGLELPLTRPVPPFGLGVLVVVALAVERHRHPVQLAAARDGGKPGNVDAEIIDRVGRGRTGLPDGGHPGEPAECEGHQMLVQHRHQPDERRRAQHGWDLLERLRDPAERGDVAIDERGGAIAQRVIHQHLDVVPDR